MIDQVITVSGDDILYNGQKVGRVTAPEGTLRDRFVTTLQDIVEDYHDHHCPATLNLLEDEDDD